ncbi:hypothetical protein NST74_13015 [Paenibacillus sp. FSL F4-0125]|uniref:hypothetical protein n=1 Tax=Paenibacillus sp. FSL F4-0125 TaxID=2954730 RepID=UPI0030F9F93C
MKRKILAFLLLSLVLLTMIGCSNNENSSEGKTDEQIAAVYIQTLGYTIVVHEGEAVKYTLEQKMLEDLDYMRLWAVQKEEPDAYIGKEIVTYRFTVKDHPLEQQFSPVDYTISAIVMLVDRKVIGGTSAPKSKIKNLVMVGGEYSLEGKTLYEIKGMSYSEWLDYWKEKYGKRKE